MKHNYVITLGASLLLAACANNTVPPSQLDNICEILREKPDWHTALLAAKEKWGAPPQIVLAIIYQESAFKHNAKPAMNHLLWFIPTGRASSAYGYPQAKDEVWGDYKRQTGQSWANRDDFADAVDFIGWYMDKSYQINGVSKWDTYKQYLNYHEGWGGYAKQSYRGKSGLITVAKKVQHRAEQYGAQYVYCRDGA